MSKILYIDTETTGLDHKKNGIWQLAGIVEIDGNVKEEFSLLMNAGDVEYEQGALDVSNITKKEIQTFDDQGSTFKQFEEILNTYIDKYNTKDKFFFCGYVAKFDEQFIREWFIKNGHKYYGSYFYSNSIDLYNLVGYVTMSIRNEIPNYKLENICKLFNLTLEDAHDALADVRVTRGLFHILKNEHLKITL